MVKIFHRTLRNGTVLRFVNTFTEAEAILKKLCEQHLPAISWDQDYPTEIIGGVLQAENGEWKYFCK